MTYSGSGEMIEQPFNRIDPLGTKSLKNQGLMYQLFDMLVYRVTSYNKPNLSSLYCEITFKIKFNLIFQNIALET